MPTPALDTLVRNLETLDYTRSRMERLYDDGKISQRDLHTVYEALFLRAVTSFEVFLEELFFAIMSENAKYPKTRVKLRMRATSAEAMREILLQGKDYLDWIPFNRTELRAKLYLKEGRPFSDLSDGDKSTIKTITLIRHAIAHKSSFATRQFEEKVIGSMNLLRGEKKPAGFLRSQFRSAPKQVRFELYVNELVRIAQALC